MVRVEERVGDDAPGFVPGKILVVDEDAHQLGDGEGGMGLINK